MKVSLQGLILIYIISSNLTLCIKKTLKNKKKLSSESKKKYTSSTYNGYNSYNSYYGSNYYDPYYDDYYYDDYTYTTKTHTSHATRNALIAIGAIFIFGGVFLLFLLCCCCVVSPTSGSHTYKSQNNANSNSPIMVDYGNTGYTSQQNYNYGTMDQGY